MSNARSSGYEDPIFGERVRRALADVADERDPLRVASALRARLEPELARRAAELHWLRRKSRGKFPHEPPMFATAKGYAQASSEAVARARARRIAAIAGDAWVADLTCGIGGDALALARAGVRLVVCDRDASLLACARANLRAAGRSAHCVLADAEWPAVSAPYLVIDPDRRAAGRRSLDPRAWSPDLELAMALAFAARGACVKLPASFTPRDAPLKSADVRWQWVSWRRELAETALWTGALARVERGRGPLREALAIDASGGEAAIEGHPIEVAIWPADRLDQARFLAEPDVAVRRAGLSGLLAERTSTQPLSPASDYLASERRPDSALLRVWRVLGHCPLDPRRVRALLALHDIGDLEVHARGHRGSSRELAQRLRGRGRKPGSLVVARSGRGHVALLVESEPEHAPDPQIAARPDPSLGLVGDEGFEPPTSSL